jgi:hypothetical protein
MSEPIHASLPSRWGITLALLLAAGVLVWHFNQRPSEAAKLSRTVSSIHPGATCSKVGVMGFAGGRSNLYGCVWNTADPLAAPTRRCDIWANGSAYDVTKTARSIFKLQGQPSPC